MTYVVLVVALALACVAGVQLFYMMFLQTVRHFDQRRMEQLERQLQRTEMELALTSRELEETQEQLEAALTEHKDTWPEIIDG